MRQLLTIFTPTYNRKHLLPRLYDSLKRQSSKNFIWMIIDDGSTDNTECMVREWIEDCKDFSIVYYKKTNGGLQTGYVEAIKHLETELAMCIDSDDRALPNTVELVEQKWNECKKNDLAGIYGYDCYESGEIIGEPFELSIKQVDLVALDTGRMKRKVYDRALVVRTDLYKKTVPSKVYENERTLNATTLHLQIARNYKFAMLHEPLILVEYQSDGMTTGMVKQYFTSKYTCLDYRVFMLNLPGGTVKFYFRHAIHYVNSCFITKSWIFNKNCPHKMIVFMALPFGIILHLYLRTKVKN